jgi:hypothetical protein
MNILSFNKITKPIYEGGIEIDCRPKAKWLVEVKRPDGTIRRPFGDKWIDNLFVNGYVNSQLGGTSFGPGATYAGDQWSFLSFFYGANSSIAVGSGSTAVSVTDTALATPIRFNSTPYPIGNNISWDSTTGDIVYVIKEQFPAETGSVTYREAAIRVTGGGGSIATVMLDLYSSGDNRILNRVVLPADVNLTAGESLVFTIAITTPTLASSAGKTITIAAQNGVNISGVLKVIASASSMAGGTVTAAGAITLDKTYPILFARGQTPVALLSDKTAFDTLGTNPTWGTTNEVNGTWTSYTAGTRVADAVFSWGNGTPASNTDFRSILFRTKTTAGANGGYQLLLDNQMTKDTAATLSIGIRFSL